MEKIAFLKIIILSYEFPTLGGGGAKVVYGLAREYVRMGHQVDALTMAYRGLSWPENVDGIDVNRIHYEIHLVGYGPYLKSLKGMIAHKHPDITWWGFLYNQSQNIRELYETSRIFVFPSESENFPIVLLEAMAAGMAIIVARVTGYAGVVSDTGILVDKRDSEAIRKALVTLINGRALRARLGKAARKRLENNFSWRSVTRQYLHTFFTSV